MIDLIIKNGELKKYFVFSCNLMSSTILFLSEPSQEIIIFKNFKIVKNSKLDFLVEINFL